MRSIVRAVREKVELQEEEIAGAMMHYTGCLSFHGKIARDLAYAKVFSDELLIAIEKVEDYARRNTR